MGVEYACVRVHLCEAHNSYSALCTLKTANQEAMFCVHTVSTTQSTV